MHGQLQLDRSRTSALQLESGGVARPGQRDGERPVDGHAERDAAGEDAARAAGARLRQRAQGPAAVLGRGGGAVRDEVEARREAGHQRRRARHRARDASRDATHDAAGHDAARDWDSAHDAAGLPGHRRRRGQQQHRCRGQGEHQPRRRRRRHARRPYISLSLLPCTTEL